MSAFDNSIRDLDWSLNAIHKVSTVQSKFLQGLHLYFWRNHSEEEKNFVYTSP